MNKTFLLSALAFALPASLAASCALPSLQAGSGGASSGTTSVGSISSSSSSPSSVTTGSGQGGATSSVASSSSGQGGVADGFMIDRAIVISGETNVHLYGVADVPGGGLVVAGEILGGNLSFKKPCDMVTGRFLLEFDANGGCVHKKALGGLKPSKIFYATAMMNDGIIVVGTLDGKFDADGKMLMANGTDLGAVAKFDKKDLMCQQAVSQTMTLSANGGAFSGQSQAIWITGQKPGSMGGETAYVKELSLDLGDLAGPFEFYNDATFWNGQSIASSSPVGNYFLATDRISGANYEGSAFGMTSSAANWQQDFKTTFPQPIARVASADTSLAVFAISEKDGSAISLQGSDDSKKQNWLHMLSSGPATFLDLAACTNGKSYAAGNHTAMAVFDGTFNIPKAGISIENALILEMDTQKGTLSRSLSLGSMASAADSAAASSVACLPSTQHVAVAGDFRGHMTLPMGAPLDAGTFQSGFVIAFH